MEKRNDDNEIVTKGYLRSELKILSSSMVTKEFLSNEFTNFKKEVASLIKESFDHHMGFYMEAMNEKIQFFMDGYADVPDKVLILRDKARENEYEHKEFKLRIRNLEGKA